MNRSVQLDSFLGNSRTNMRGMDAEPKAIGTYPRRFVEEIPNHGSTYI